MQGLQGHRRWCHWLLYRVGFIAHEVGLIDVEGILIVMHLPLEFQNPKANIYINSFWTASIQGKATGLESREEARMRRELTMTCLAIAHDADPFFNTQKHPRQHIGQASMIEKGQGEESKKSIDPSFPSLRAAQRDGSTGRWAWNPVVRGIHILSPIFSDAQTTYFLRNIELQHSMQTRTQGSTSSGLRCTPGKKLRSLELLPGGTVVAYPKSMSADFWSSLSAEPIKCRDCTMSAATNPQRQKRSAKGQGVSGPLPGSRRRQLAGLNG